MVDRPAALWRVPPLPRLYRVADWGAFTVEWVLGGYPDRPQRPLPNRWTLLQSGGLEQVNVRILGDPPWAPPAFDRGRHIELSSTRASTSVGIESTRRVIPLGDLMALRVRRPESRAEAKGVGRRAWVLELRDESSGKHAALVGDLADLALVASVAGWDEPPGMPTTPRDRWRRAPLKRSEDT